MLTYRKKNSGGAYLVRGFVDCGHFGRKGFDEHSSGCVREVEVKAYCSKLEEDARQELMHGVAVVRRKVTWAEAKAKWLKVENHHTSNLSRAVTLEFAFHDKTLGQIDAAAFADMARDFLPGRAKNTIERHRGTLNAIFAANGVKTPEIPSYAEKNIVAMWLPHDEATALIGSYVHHVQPIARVAADCGLRASENLLLEVHQCRPQMGDYGCFVIGDAQRSTKNKTMRTVPWTQAVRAAVLPLILDRDPFDRVFLNAYGEPYSDTRKTGGNPVSSAHKTAMKDAGRIKAGYKGKLPFKWHDWRHHFATWGLASKEHGGRGWSVPQVMDYGGWTDIETVQRYAGVIDNLYASTTRRA